MELPERSSPQSATPEEPAPPGRNRLALTALILTLGVIITPLFRPITAFDAGWNLRLGQWIWEHGRLPDHDPLLHTTDLPAPRIGDRLEEIPTGFFPGYKAHWLGQLVMYGAWSAAGDLGLILFRAACFLLALGALELSLRRLGVGLVWRLAALGLSSMLIDSLVLVRPSAVTIALCSLSAALWWTMWRRRRAVWGWIAVALLPLWAQLHAGFLYGLMLAAAWIVGWWIERLLPPDPAEPSRPRSWLRSRGGAEAWLPRWQLALMGILAAGLPFLLHPLGPTGLVRLLDALRKSEQLSPGLLSVEMQPPGPLTHALAFALSLIALVLIPAVRRRFPAPFLLLLLGGSATALLTARSVFFQVVLALPVVVATGADLVRAVTERRPGRTRNPPFVPLRGNPQILPWVLCLVVGLSVALEMSSSAQRWKIGWHGVHPEATARFLRRDPPPGNPFNTYNQGGFLVWQVPDVRWFIDGRVMVPRLTYAYYTFRRHPAAGSPPAWRRLFQHYDVDWAVVPLVFDLVDFELTLLLMRAPDWWPVAVGDGTMVLVRRAPESAEYLARHRMSVSAYQAGLSAGYPRAEQLAREYGAPLVAVDYLMLLGAFPAARERLGSIGPAEADFAAAQERLARWPSYVLPIAAKLAEMEGGDDYRQLREQLRAEMTAGS